MASFAPALAISRSGPVQGREQQQVPNGLRGRGCEEWMAVSTNCRAWGIRRVVTVGNLRLALGLQSRHCGFGADLIKVPPSQPLVWRVSAIDRLNDEFLGAEIDDHGGVGSETSPPEDQDTNKDVQVDLQLPRRRLLVAFTCNVCQTRTQRLVNPEAYKRGTVYVQCGGCEAYHQLVDNLGLVVEYDFRKETDSDSS